MDAKKYVSWQNKSLRNSAILSVTPRNKWDAGIRKGAVIRKGKFISAKLSDSQRNSA